MQVESLEARQLLSGTVIPALAQLPILTMFRFNSTLSGIEQAVGTLPRTQNISQFDATLATLSARLPYGRQLLSQWKNDQSIYDPAVSGSGLAMQEQLLSDTVAYVQNGTTQGLFAVTGTGASIFYKGKQSTDSDVLIHQDPGNDNTQYRIGYALVTEHRRQLYRGHRVGQVLGSKFHNQTVSWAIKEHIL